MNDSPSPHSAARSSPEDLLRHLPPSAVLAFKSFQQSGDPALLDPVVFAILEDFIPRKPEPPLAQQAPEMRLIEDLGFDSLAITELVFFTEELFGISISNEEIVTVHTIDDLRRFVRQKVTNRAAA